MDTGLPAAPHPSGSGAPAVTKHFCFAQEDIAAHPCYQAGRARPRRWAPAQVAMVLASVAACVAICLRISEDFALPTAVMLAAMGLNYQYIHLEVRRLRDQGVLRELCLAGQPPILTLLAIQRGTPATWMAPVQGFAVTTVMTFSLVTKDPLGPAMLAAVLAGATVLSIALARMADRRPAAISRAEVVRTIGKARLFRMAGCCSFLPLLAYPLFRPLAGAVYDVVVMAAGGAIAFTIPAAERRLLSVPDAEFEEWVEEWCVGLTPAAG